MSYGYHLGGHEHNTKLKGVATMRASRAEEFSPSIVIHIVVHTLQAYAVFNN